MIETDELMEELKKLLSVYSPFSTPDIDPISTSEEEDLEYVKQSLQRSLKIPQQFMKTVIAVCECGAEKCGYNKHSDYCPKYKA